MVRQESIASGHRGWKRHPVGGWAMFGGASGIPINSTLGPVSGGNAPIRAFV